MLYLSHLSSVRPMNFGALMLERERQRERETDRDRERERKRQREGRERVRKHTNHTAELLINLVVTMSLCTGLDGVCVCVCVCVSI